MRDTTPRVDHRNAQIVRYDLAPPSLRINVRSVLNVQTIDAAVRLCVMVMPLACWPVMVYRRPGLTLIHMEARATRRENALAITDACTPEEAVAVRRAYGMEDHITADWGLTDEPALLWVPPALRLAGWPALQGGEELVRRRMLGPGAIRAEMAALEAERVVPSARNEPVRRLI